MTYQLFVLTNDIWREEWDGKTSQEAEAYADLYWSGANCQIRSDEEIVLSRSSKGYWEMMIICAACGLPITGRDYKERHWGHEEGCPRHDDPDADIDCDCDLEFHPACCPDCAGDNG